MPPRRAKKGMRKIKRKGYRGYKRCATVNVNRALQPIPQRFIVKMKYAEAFNITTGVGAIGAYRYNLNSIFDPNATGIGHQPYGHDTFQTLYNRYRVIKCSYLITAQNTTNSANFVVAALPANETVGVATMSEARENPRCKYITQGTGSPILKLKGGVYLPSLVGRNKAQYMADDRYQATFGTSPNEQAILNIYGAPLSEAGDITINCNITLVYHVECFDVKNLAQS